MPIKKRKSTIANADNLLIVSDDLGICCEDALAQDFTTAEFDTTATVADTINVTPDGGSPTDLVFPGGSVDWTDPANDAALRTAIGDAINAAGYIMIDGGIILTRGATDNLLTVLIQESTLTLNWIGVTATQRAFTASAML